MLPRRLPRAFALPPAYHRRRGISSLGLASLDAWSASVTGKTTTVTDTSSLTTLLKLHYTLPTRCGPLYSTPPPLPLSPVQPGHHLVLFPPLFPESQLKPDGTEPGFTPPPPFSRRMWAAGEMEWVEGNDLGVGEEVKCEVGVEKVERKGWEGERPKVFVWQRRTVSNAKGVALVERRAHVFQPAREDEELETPVEPRQRPSPELPSPDFSITYTPTPLTLFRFSALTFNAHRIHYDPEFCQKVDGQPERLTHAPLTALLLLESLSINLPPTGRIAHFAYRAVRPLLVNEPITFSGAWREGARGELVLWATREGGEGTEVAMTGSARVTGLH